MVTESTGPRILRLEFNEKIMEKITDDLGIADDLHV